MNYLILVIVFTVVTWIVSKKTFYWETIIKYLWKQIYQISDLMASEIHAGANETLFIERYKKSLGLRGNLINAILDYINNIKKEDEEEETFGYGRFDFDTILNTAKSNPDAFRKLKRYI